jgi:sporulation protein YlmC with PRC-barrel domain
MRVQERATIMTNQILMSASTLNGDDVKNTQGENLGHVKDIMLDTENNRVAYYVLSFGGMLGMGDKLFAIPPEAMKLNTNDKCFILNIDKDRLKKAEGFDKDRWPNMADATFRSNLYQHYGLTDRFAA